MRLATRGSPLALHQTETVAALLRAAHPGLDVELYVVRTRGDQDAAAPLDQIGGQGVFVTEVEAAVAEEISGTQRGLRAAASCVF